jgi:hypothetical protein
VVIAAGARTLLVGNMKRAPLSLQALYGKGEIWSEGEALVKGFGLKAWWEKGRFVVTMR